MSDKIMTEREQTEEEWIAKRKRKKQKWAVIQALPYEVKVQRAELRALEFINKIVDMGINAHVSLGGL